MGFSECIGNLVCHYVITTQSGNKLHILVTDNGELVSNSTCNWCTEEGIEHCTTVPYTSAHNSCAECLHRTIVSKGCTMHISCNTPTLLWDKFFDTAAYLTNLTAASANNGQMPYQLWFDCKLSLSHLHEIGCHAFALQQPPPLKIHIQSLPCIMIVMLPI